MNDRADTRRRRRAVGGVLVLLAAAVAVAGGSASAPAASSGGTVVSAEIPTATTVGMTGCQQGSAATTFGIVTPGTQTSTSADCSITFGSSNSTASLRVSQADEHGDALALLNDGVPDPTFGTSGRTTPALAGDQRAGGIGVQSTGKVVQAFGNADFQVSRYDAVTGALDATFGVGGVRTFNIGGTERPRDMVVLPDDSIVVVGRTSSGSGDTAVAKFTAAGAVDTSFGTSGSTVIDAAAGYEDVPNSVLVQPDGKIVVAGWWSTDPVTDKEHEFVLRLEADGSLDTGFATGGIFRDDAGPDTGYDGEAVLQPDPASQNDKVVYADRNWDDGSYTAFGRLGMDGRLDPTFGSGGRASLHFAVGQPTSIAAQDDGRLLVTGSRDSGADAYVGRATAAGAIDTTWNGTGNVDINEAGGTFTPSDVTVDSAGRVVVTGYFQAAGADSLLVFRYRSDGTLDPSFGTGGRLAISLSDDAEASGVVASDGRLVIGGATSPGSDWDRFAVRLGARQVVSDYDGSHQWDAGDDSWSAFGICLRTLTGATQTWSIAPGNACDVASNDSRWQGVPDGRATAGNVVGTTTGAGVLGTAGFQFGVKMRGDQPPGDYSARIAFDVLAP